MQIPYHLQQIAIMGTEHALAPELILSKPFEQIRSSREGQLLLSAAGIGLGRQAGYIAEKFETFPLETPHHGKKVIHIKAVLHLMASMRHFIRTDIFRHYSRRNYQQYSNPHFFYEWCVTFLASDKRLPGEILPRLLNFGIRYEQTRNALWFVLGEQGQWLAKERPDKWHWFLNLERPSFHEIYPASSERDAILLRLIHERDIPMRVEKILRILSQNPYRFSAEAAQSIVQFFRYTWADAFMNSKEFQTIARNFVIHAPLVTQQLFMDLIRERGYSEQFYNTLIEVIHFRQEMQRAICL